tara:strand:+ start:49 stop:171 length:123 start_codon:yes stop_codon:yes gene_type:complete
MVDIRAPDAAIEATRFIAPVALVVETVVSTTSTGAVTVAL